MTTDLDTLESLARAATPGPWSADLDEQGVFPSGHVSAGDVMVCTTDSEPGPVEECLNAVFIAACDPTTVLALIAELRALRKVRDEYVVGPISMPIPQEFR